MPSIRRYAALCVLLCCAIPVFAEEHGLVGTYYSNMDFSGVSTTRIDPNLNFDWGSAAPASGIGVEFWSAIWTGAITVPADDAYTFTTRSDDGVQLIIDGVEVVRNWTGHPPTEDVGTVALAHGVHLIEVRFYNSHNSATMQLSWQTSTMSKAIIPTSAFSPVVPPARVGTGTGLLGSYYADSHFGSAPNSRLDAAIDFNWGLLGPGMAVSPSLFSVEWRGWLEPQYSESYKFYADADDCFYLEIDGVSILGSTDYGITTEATGSRYLVAGKRYEVVAKYRQINNAARARLSWSCPLTQKQIIPTSQLYPCDPATIADVRLVSPEESFVSPAWCEVIASTARAQISGVSGGQTLQASREDSTRWYLGNSTNGIPGLVLQPGANEFAVTATVGTVSRSIQSGITWMAYDLASPPYGASGAMDLRQGDTLLVTAQKPGQGVVLSVSPTDGIGSSATYAGAPGDSFPVPFSVAGSYMLSASIDGVSVGTLQVRVIGCDLRAPIACEVAFQRDKTITLSGPAGQADIWIGSSDWGNLDVVGKAADGMSRVLGIRALGLTAAQLQVRIGGADGPLISGATVVPFIMKVNSETSIDVIKRYPDGTLLTQGQLTMIPLVGDLDVKLDIFTGGAHFLNGTLLLNASTNTFSPEKGNGIFLYQIIRSAQAGSALCHHTSIYQGADIVGRH